MNTVIKQKLLNYLHRQNCPHCGASLQNVSIEIADAIDKSVLFIVSDTHCDREEEYIAYSGTLWLKNYPNEVFYEIDRLHNLTKGE